MTVRRRKFITLLGSAAVAWSGDARSQVSTKVHRLGSLDPARPLSANSSDAATLLTALAERGYMLGGNLAYDARSSGGDNEKLPDVLQDFKASGVDVIVTIGYPATVAAKSAGIPTVVAAGVGDPVATGLVKSLAHPGGTVTGISDNATTLSTKRLSLLKDLLPNLRRVAMLWNADDVAMSLRYEASAKASRAACALVGKLGLLLRPALGRSRSASTAPRGSPAILAIVFPRGPNPKRCSARAASAVGSRAMISPACRIA